MSRARAELSQVQSEQRAAFFTHAMQQTMNDKTILAIDSTCVPDPRVDKIVHWEDSRHPTMGCLGAI